jgi:polysaccharide pyruvyl transferase WcaK-like protein
MVKDVSQKRLVKKGELRPTALILAGDVVGNLGDHAIAMAICSQLKAIDPNINIYIFGSSSKGTFLGDASIIPLSVKGVMHLISVAYVSKIVICGGGGLFQDDDSLIKMPYWGILLLLIRLLNSNLIGYSIGVGPLTSGIGQFFAKLAFSCLKIISVRDPEAYKLACRLTSKTVALVPDPAIVLPKAAEHEARQVMRESGIPLDGTPLIGVAARRWFHHKRSIIPYRIAHRFRSKKPKDTIACDQLITLLAGVLDRVVCEHGAYVVFLPTYNVDHEGDDWICEAIRTKMDANSACTVRLTNPTVYKSLTSYLSLMIGARMHPTILAAASNVPVIGLAYNQKFDGFFELINNRQNLLWIDDFVFNNRSEDLYLRIEHLINQTNGCYSTEITTLTESIREFNQSVIRNHLEDRVSHDYMGKGLRK